MFVGRSREIAELNRLYEMRGFQFPIIYGRRRIGKTRLIREFLKGKKSIFYMATQDDPFRCLRDFTECVKDFAKEDKTLAMMDSFSSWDDAFDYVARLAGDERIVLVVDEFPYLAQSYEAISSVLQRHIDLSWKQTQIYLILSGSSMSFMEEQVLGYESPLYGRRTGQIKLEPLPYYEAVLFFRKWKDEERLLAYGICGGVPQYLEYFSRWRSLRDAVENEFLSLSGSLKEEPDILLKEELREPAIYNSIIQAIASGANKTNEIASKVGKNTNGITTYLKNLVALGIIEKRMPIEETNGKKSIYAIKDQLFYFWYRFIPTCRTQIAMGMSNEAYAMKIEPYLSDYFGAVFENVCEQFLWREIVKKGITADYEQSGRWWGTDPVRKEQEEIDIVFTGKEDILVCECKWQKQKVDFSVYNTLLRRGAIVQKSRRIRYAIFSKSGFTKELSAYQDDRMALYTLEDIL